MATSFACGLAAEQAMALQPLGARRAGAAKDDGTMLLEAGDPIGRRRAVALERIGRSGGPAVVCVVPYGNVPSFTPAAFSACRGLSSVPIVVPSGPTRQQISGPS